MSSNKNNLLNEKVLRKQIRELRRNIQPEVQLRAAKSVTETALSQPDSFLGNHLALYMPADGEIDTQYLLEALIDKGKHCYLPVMAEATTLLFRLYDPGKPLVTNFYGLLEPDPASPTIEPDELTTVFMPLIAFDEHGNRLGMGKGYYDRAFSFLKENRAAGPTLIGLAHECQRVERLEVNHWDVPLKGIITDRKFYQVS